jgi:endonuclease G
MFLSFLFINLTLALEILPNVSKSGQLVKHQFYSLSYVESNEGAEWVSYELRPEHLWKNSERESAFKQDPKIESGSVKSSLYLNSGFDRGHLLPARDRAFSQESMKETFYTSNVLPQSKELNRGVWKQLEEEIRSYVERTHEVVQVITGPIWSHSSQKLKGEVLIPEKFYKIIFDGKRMLAFIIPQVPNKELEHYQVSVDEVEFKTKVDFFARLKNKFENQMEQKTDKEFLMEVIY